MSTETNHLFRSRALLVTAALAIACSQTKKLEPGATCSLNSDCTDPLSCKFGKCHRTCSETRDCARDERCVQVLGGASVCQLASERSCGAGCPSPLVCGPDDTCRNSCTSGAGCLTGQTCVGNAVCAETSEPLAGGGGGNGGQGDGSSLPADAADANQGGIDASLPGDAADSCVPGAPMACQEPIDTPDHACPILLQTVIEGRLNAPSHTKDYYKFPVQGGLAYTITFSNIPTGGGSALYLAADLLIAATTTPLTRVSGNNGGGGFGGTVYPEIKPTSDGTVLLTVTVQGAAGAAAYKFSVVPSAGICRDRVTLEPNNSPSSAAPVAFGEVIKGDLAAPEDTVDYFRFEAQKDVAYTVTFSNTTQPVQGVYLNYALVADGVSTSLGGENGNNGGGGFGGTRYSELKPMKAGTIIIQVTAQGTAGTYKFSVVASDHIDRGGDFEPNNSPSSAAPIALGQVVRSDLTAPEDIVDYFRFEAQKDVAYTVTFSNTTQPVQGLYLDYALVADGISTSLGGENGNNGGGGFGGTRYSELKPMKAGTIIIKVTAQGTAGNYVFSVVGSDHIDRNADFEPNNSPSSAAPLEIGTEVMPSINNTDDTLDYYQFAVDANATYMVTASVLTPGAGLQMEAMVDQFRLLQPTSVAAQPVSKPLMSTVAGTVRLLINAANAPCVYKLQVTKQ